MVAGDIPRRVHPGTIAIGFLRKAPQNLLALPVFAGWMSGRGIGWALIIAAIAGGVALFFTWLNWWRFTYMVGAEELVVQRGVLSLSRRSIPLERIQDVSIERKPLHRLFGLAEVRVETGGGDADEAVLDSVSLAEAERLRAALRGHYGAAASAAETEAGVPAEPPALVIVFAMSPGRVLLLGLFSFSLVWLAALFGIIQSLDQFLDLGWDQLKEYAGTAREVAQARFSVVAVLIVAAIALALGVISGVVRTVLRDWGFTLLAGDGRFRRTRGLLTRSEVVVAMRRVQLALVQRGPLRGWLGWNSLSVQTLGGSNDPSGRQLLAPLAKEAEVAEIVRIAGLPAFQRLPLRPVAAGHVIRALVRTVTFPLAVIGAATLFATPLALIGLIILPPMILAALLQRRFHRFALLDNSLQVMRGVVAQRDWIVPIDNVQVVTLRETWFQRLLGVASVEVDTAGAKGQGRPDVTDINLPDARALLSGLVAKLS
jgi:putative membrane protein